MARECAVIMGAGGGLGAALARRFARGGLAVAVARRDEAALRPVVDEIASGGGTARAYGADATDEASVEALFERAEADLGPVRAAVFNAGTILIKPVTETTQPDFRRLWEVCCLGGFLTGRAAARRMGPRGAGTILFTGATAALRGGAHFAAFASAKFGLRAVAQSMARELGPEGIHVAHIVVDGMIEGPRTRAMLADRKIEPDTILKPDDIAETFWSVHEQKRSAWTFELDLRPFSEKW